MPSSIRESDTESEGASVAPSEAFPRGARAKPARESGPAEGTRAEPALERDRSVALARALRGVGRFARRKPLGALGALIVVAMLVMAAFAERIAPYDYDETVRGARMKPPSAAHWLGTDNLSRDMWSRVVYGARVSITVGFATIGLAIFLATVIGVSSGYFGGAYDLVIQRLVDAINSRVIRGAAIAVAQSTYVEAARALGCGHARIIARHILPNVMATIIILATIGLGATILAESSLSFLGFGVPPPFPSWGAMLSGSGRTYMFRAPWMAVWPGVAISLAVFGFNMLGDALRDVLDPRLRGGAR